MSRPEDRSRVAFALATVLVGSLAYWYVLDRRRRTTERRKDDERFDAEQIRLKLELARMAESGNLGTSSASSGVVSLSAASCGGVTDRYSWTQDEREIVVAFRVEASTRARDCLVEISTKSIHAVVKGKTLLEGELTRRIVKDDSYWELEESTGGGKALVVTLTKLRRTYAKFHWASVCLGEPEVDVASFGDPVVGVNGQRPGDVEAMMEEVRGMRRDAEQSK